MSPNARLCFGPLPSGSFITPTGKRKESLRVTLLLGQAGRQPEAIRPPSETPVRKIRSQSNPECGRIQVRESVFNVSYTRTFLILQGWKGSRLTVRFTHHDSALRFSSTKAIMVILLTFLYSSLNSGTCCKQHQGHGFNSQGKHKLNTFFFYLLNTPQSE